VHCKYRYEFLPQLKPYGPPQQVRDHPQHPPLSAV